MASGSIPRAYAEGLYRAAKHGACEQAVGEELSALAAVLAKEKRAGAFFATPAIPAGEKRKVLRKWLAGKTSPTTLNFLLLLIDKRRQSHLAEISAEYTRLLDEGAGILRGEVVSAVPLEPASRERLERTLSDRLDKTVRLSERVDPRLIGGARVVVGDFVVDGGFDHRLRQLHRHLLGKGASR